MSKGDFPEIIIYASRRRLILAWLISIGFTTFSLWLLYLGARGEDCGPYSCSVMQVTGVLASAFFGWASFLFTRRLVRRKPALVINSEGLLHNTSLTSFGQIDWRDITSVRHENVSRTLVPAYRILIELRDPELHVQQMTLIKNFIANISLLFPQDRGAQINRAGIDRPLRDVESLIRRYWIEFRKNR